MRLIVKKLNTKIKDRHLRQSSAIMSIFLQYKLFYSIIIFCIQFEFRVIYQIFDFLLI